MMHRQSSIAAAYAVTAFLGMSSVAGAQRGGPPPSDRLKAMPGYARFTEMAPKLAGAFKSGAINATWAPDSRSFTYTHDDKSWRFDVATMKATEVPGEANTASGRGGRGFPGAGGNGRGGGRGCPVAIERGRQCPIAATADGKLRAEFRDQNIWVSDANGGNAIQLTTDGSREKRIKYGTSSWVYGEELGQTTAMWWSPDGSKLAFYRFDETPVNDYYLQLKQTGVYDSLDVEAYPKAGSPNPIADIYVYDAATKKQVKVDVRDGKPFANETVGYYAYAVQWTADGKELLINRTNRRQNIMDIAACDPSSGKCRIVVREEWPTGWVDNTPAIRWLADGKRFILTSERTGFANFYLYDLTGKLLSTITKGQFEVQNIVALDEATNTMFYMARDGDNFMKSQLHRVKLDGTGDVRLTDPAFTHTATLSPDRKYFVDIAQTHDTPPISRLVDATTGRVVSDIAKSDISAYASLTLRKSEMFTYLAADGKTQLHGIITFPSSFDPSKKYPTLVPVYGGPASGSNTANETFKTPNAQAEYGFLIVNLNSRATPGMGKRVLDALYLKLGQTEMDDMAAGIKALWSRPYFDKDRVGIYGTSYGGYTSAMMILRYPDVIAAASSSSPVTAWDNYDTIYTERYMWIPQENPDGYRKGAAAGYAANLKGRLMLYYGTADNNVHPNNMMQLIKSLSGLGKSFDVQVGPDLGHTGLNQNRMMEFFLENLASGQKAVQ
jgi:dipeptidyl-peptidase-4